MTPKLPPNSALPILTWIVEEYESLFVHKIASPFELKQHHEERKSGESKEASNDTKVVGGKFDEDNF